METTTLLLFDPNDPISLETVKLLSDWSAAGWLNRFALLSTTETLARGQAVAQAWVVLPPTPTGPRSLTSLSGLIGGGQVRIAALDPVGADPSWIAARSRRFEAANLLTRLGNRVGMVDLVISWHGGHWDPDMHSWRGWDTLIAAPQQSSSPMDPGYDLFCDPDSPAQVMALAGHAAAFTANVAALWAGVEASPWDHSDQADDTRMARAYYVRLDGTAVLSVLRDASLSAAALRAPDALRAMGTSTIEQRLSALRGKLALERLPPAPQQQARKSIGPWAAIKLLVSYLARSLVMGPSALARTMVARTRSNMAGRLTGAIFGNDSVMEVTGGGLSARDRADEQVRRITTSAHDLTAVLKSLEKAQLRLAPAAPPSAQETFWRSTLDTVLVMASGTNQGTANPMVEEGLPRWFPAEDIAPPAGTSWTPVDGVTLSSMSGAVPVYDLLACEQALRELAESSKQDSQWRDEIEQNRRDLEQASSTWRASFMGRIGSMLVQEIEQCRAMLAQRLDRVRALSEPPISEAEDLAEELSRFTKTATLIALLVGTAVAALDMLEVLSVPAWQWVPALVLLWMLALVIKYLTVQRRVFQLQYRQDEQESGLRQIAAELPFIVENSRRLIRVYDQYLVWAQLIPAFLGEPFGRSSQERSEVARMAGEVPPCVVSGRYVLRDPQKAAQDAAHLVRSVKTSASLAWARYRDRSYVLLADKHEEFTSQVPEDVFSLEDQRLSRWLEVATSAGPRGPIMAPDLAEELGREQVESVVEGLGGEGMRSFVAECFDIVSDDGHRIPSHRPGAQAAPFRFDAFSMSGLSNELTVPDPESAHVGGARPGMATADVLHNEVSSVLITTRNLTFADLSLMGRQTGAEQPEATTTQAPMTF